MKLLKTATIIIALIAIFHVPSFSQTFYATLQEYTEKVTTEFNQIEKSRIKKLKSLAAYVFEDWKKTHKINGLFICTHNSRRSHMASLWFQATSYYYGIPNFNTYSGGTKTTALNPRAANALNRAGFKYQTANSEEDNPVYFFTMGERYPVTKMYSKIFDAKENPTNDFFAVLVCSDADKSCPSVTGADKRFSLPYDDPRFSDNTASEQKSYDDTCRKIAREMFYVLSLVKKEVVEFQEKKK